ncbi:MAG: ABC transporter permease [Marinifilaceae bacterium]|jgi:putative ABC transport system permease protein|nr:ABC transporter permease [Marinifilaceae bacterium]
MLFINNLKIALRNNIRNKLFSIINITGLVLGISCCLIISLYVIQESRYDNYHKDIDRLYRVGVSSKLAEMELNLGSNQYPLAQTLQKEVPGIESFCRIVNNDYNIIEIENKKYREKIFSADSSLFEIFNFELIIGDKNALTKENVVIISAKSAKKYFGSIQNAVNKNIKINNKNYRINGIYKDLVYNTHFHAEIISSLKGNRWADANKWAGPDSAFTYLKLEKNADVKDVEQKAQILVTKYLKPAFSEFFNLDLSHPNYYRYYLIPLRDIHLKSDTLTELSKNGNIVYIRIFIIIAIFILLIACINFSNLTTAKASSRSKEIGVKKSLGSTRIKLMTQFFLESIMVSIIALIVSLILLEISIPILESEFNIVFHIKLFDEISLILFFFAIAIVAGILSGLYSAIYLSSLNAVSILKSVFKTGKKAEIFRNILVVIQFSISIFLIISTLLIKKQLDFIENKDLGYNKENLLVIRNISALKDRQSFKSDINNLSSVVKSSFASNLPGVICNGTTVKKENSTDNKGYSIRQLITDYDYLETMDTKLIKGRTFDRNFARDSFAVVINKAAAERLNYDTGAIGKTILFNGDRKYKIIGITENFHSNDMKSDYFPYAIVIYMKYYYEPDNLAIRIKATNKTLLIKQIESIWKEATNDSPFQYEFMDDIFHNLHKAENNTMMMFSAFSILAVLIACLGLFGLVSFTTEKRIKEIGIRKTLGASVSQIVIILNKDLIKWIVFSFIIACPCAYYFIDNWLNNFAFHTEIGIGLFIISGLIIILIALITVSWQAFKAATKNPVDALRYE